jgi:phenylpropionate dioxygenase-like ring-hydroxylating dioxygenase large terminal subunit
MPFLRNAWYCAAWAYELEEEQGHFARKLLGESVLLMRKEDGVVAAMGNVCPHRFAPLHKGPRTGDVFSCPYHGLEFNSDGQCVGNPNHGGVVPSAARVKTYPLVERWGALWIWMGDPARADPDGIPDFSMAAEREGWAVVRGLHLTAAHYELVVDNLMDRTHVQHLHPLLRFSSEKPADFAVEQSVEQTGNLIWDYHVELNSPKFPILSLTWPDAPDDIMNYFDVRWEAPGNMLLHAGSVQMNTDRKIGSHTEGANLITPSDENHTYYFWSNARDSNIHDKEIDAGIKKGVGGTFEFEDGAMVADVSELMGTNDLMSLKPLLLPSDEAAVRARRIMAKLIAEEQAEERSLAD